MMQLHIVQLLNEEGDVHLVHHDMLNLVSSAFPIFHF